MKGADARADQGVATALFAVGGVGQIAQNRAAQGTGDGTGRRIVAPGRGAVGIHGGAGRGPQHGDDAQARDDQVGAHGVVLLKFRGM